MPWYLWRGIYNNKQCSGITKTINKDYLEKQLANSNIKFVDASIIVNKIKFNAKERLNFYNSVLMLLNSGIPLLNVFKILIARAKSKKQAIVLNALVTDLEFGLQEISLLGVIPKDDYVFWQIGLENNLINFLEQLVLISNINLEFKKKIIKLLIMPLVSFFILLIVVVFMIFFVAPELAQLTGLNSSVLNYLDLFKDLTIIPLFVLGLILFFYTIKFLYKLIKLWFFPELQILSGLRIFAALLKSGLNSSRAFYFLKNIEAHYYWQELFKFQENGLSFTQSLYEAKWHIFVPELVSLVELSEYHGDLCLAVNSALNFYTQKTIHKTEIIINFVQPLFFLIIALLLIFVLSEIYLPIIDSSIILI